MAFTGDSDRIPFRFTTLGKVLEFFRLLYVFTAHNARGTQRNALVAILLRIVVMASLGAAFFVIMSVTGIRNMGGRTDQIWLLLTGLFLFFIHIGTFKTAMTGLDPNSGMNVHPPVTPLLELFSSALGQLYINIIAIGVIGLAIHVLFIELEVDNLRGVFVAVFWTWLSGVAIGTVFSGLSAFIPVFQTIGQVLMRRANMIFSGKMFAANTLPPAVIPFFIWNPLFHTIDQCRGAVFRNYVPRYTSIEYPMWFTFVAFVIALLLFHARKKLL